MALVIESSSASRSAILGMMFSKYWFTYSPHDLGTGPVTEPASFFRSSTSCMTWCRWVRIFTRRSYASSEQFSWEPRILPLSSPSKGYNGAFENALRYSFEKLILPHRGELIAKCNPSVESWNILMLVSPCFLDKVNSNLTWEFN